MPSFPPTRRRWRPGALLAVLCAAMPCLRAQAQGTGGAAGSPLPRVLMPGDSALRGSRLVPSAVRYALTMYRDADEIPVGRLTETTALDTMDGVPVVRRSQIVQRGTMQFWDTTWIDARTLAPRARRAMQQNRRVQIEFTGRRVKGTVGPLDVPPVVLDTTLAMAFFDAGAWDLLLRALPLEQGVAARFAVYDTEAGLREYRVHVTGRTTVQGEDAHVVVLTVARNRESVVWVSVATGLVLQIETMLGETTMLRQVRLRDERSP